MQKAYQLDESGSRKLAFLYSQSSISKRYSVINDFSLPSDEWQFIPGTTGAPVPAIECRMDLFEKEALPISIEAISTCIDGLISATEVTHLITVSCTGMSAPGLDLQIAEAMQMNPGLFRTSVNFMGCYAAIHALKLAKMICDSTPNSNVIIVATELCTIHFQNEFSQDNAASSLLFGDGSAAVLVSNQLQTPQAIQIDSFYSMVAYEGKQDMSWRLSSKGFLMTLSAYIPQLIQHDIASLVHQALQQQQLTQSDITHWCIHPGGKKILEVIQKQMNLTDEDISYSRSVLNNYGNMSSPTVLFVLKEIMYNPASQPANIFGVAFGPGLTMETFIASKP